MIFYVSLSGSKYLGGNEERLLSRQNRKRFCSRIATGDYDAHSLVTQFEKILFSRERQIAMLEDQIADITFFH